MVESADAKDEVFYVDEADIDLNPRIGSTYMRRGKQLVVLRPGKNVKRYVAGALNARSGKVRLRFLRLTARPSERYSRKTT